MSAHQHAPTAEPFYIKIHPEDNVAIIANTNGLPAGTRFPCGLVLTEPVPQGHKVALVDIAAGQPSLDAILRYPPAAADQQRLSDAGHEREHRRGGGPFPASQRSGGGLHRGGDSESGLGEAGLEIQRWRRGCVSDLRPRRYWTGADVAGINPPVFTLITDCSATAAFASNTSASEPRPLHR